MKTLVWFRNDLRVADNPALHAASRQGPVVACFIDSPDQWRRHDVGDRRITFVRASVAALRRELARLGVPLVVVQGSTFDEAPQIVEALVTEHQAQAVHWNAEYPVNEARRDRAVADRLSKRGTRVETRHGSVLAPPGSVLKDDGGPYTVFTPFKRRFLRQIDVCAPLPVPDPQGPPIADGAAASEADAAQDIEWRAGEAAALGELADFANARLARYGEQRDFPALHGTSQLSAHLSVGALSPRQAVHTAVLAGETWESSSWLNELVWREFYRHVVALFPRVSRGGCFRAEYDHFPWERDAVALQRWQAGQTGYPFVDAAMRQLNETGWMHNRLRMVAAMFLSKHLLIDWREGERYFMQQLVDGDFASNNGGWQWSASTGTDAAPYFRIFNPASQGQRFDAKGEFVRRFVPELADVEAPHKVVVAGTNGYPQPVVEHAPARQRAIDRFKSF